MIEGFDEVLDGDADGGFVRGVVAGGSDAGVLGGGGFEFPADGEFHLGL